MDCGNGFEVLRKIYFTIHYSVIDEALNHKLHTESFSLEKPIYVTFNRHTARCDTEREVIFTIEDLNVVERFILTTEESTRKVAGCHVILAADILAMLPAFRSHPLIRPIAFGKINSHVNGRRRRRRRSDKRRIGRSRRRRRSNQQPPSHHQPNHTAIKTQPEVGYNQRLINIISPISLRSLRSGFTRRNVTR
ncbi:unnamed protein product [Caenorhabditis brenneri]